MLIGQTFFELDLISGSAVSLFGGAGSEVACLSGAVLLSEENGGDVALRAGQRCRLARRGRAVLENATASTRARIRLYPAKAGSAPGDADHDAADHSELPG